MKQKFPFLTRFNRFMHIVAIGSYIAVVGSFYPAPFYFAPFGLGIFGSLVESGVDHGGWF